MIDLGAYRQGGLNLMAFRLMDTGQSDVQDFLSRMSQKINRSSVVYPGRNTSGVTVRAQLLRPPDDITNIFLFFVINRAV